MPAVLYLRSHLSQRKVCALHKMCILGVYAGRHTLKLKCSFLAILEMGVGGDRGTFNLDL